LNNRGAVCRSVVSGLGGAQWPAGTPNQYIFASGVQIAGIIADDAPLWAGDTVGAPFYDTAGGDWLGEGLTPIYNSLDPEDVEDWPNAAVARDPNVFAAPLLGRNVVSQEDTWVRYWDDPGELGDGRRTHPMGILVDQRTMAWNYPTGNEDILYLVFTLYNISASNPDAYAGLDPAIQDEIAAIGADWADGVQDRLGVVTPADGYRIDSVYVAFVSDPDIARLDRNASTTMLPFNLGIAYDGGFSEPAWSYPLDVHGPPFGPYPGIHGVKYLQSPIDPTSGDPLGLTLFSTYCLTAGCVLDPLPIGQFWRTMSGNLQLGLDDDRPCEFPKESRLCSLHQDPTDIRFMQSSGPFSLNPGEAVSIIVAYIFAAPLEAPVLPYVGGYLPPGIPADDAALVGDLDAIRDIDRVSGWVSHADLDGDGSIQEDEVEVVPRSLLDRALVAQSTYDAGFLVPFAPEPPNFFLVPGNEAVTVVWQPSATETIGDPFFSVASDPQSALFDPNFRFNDVEGYRIYRGRSRAQLELIAQFDYAGTTFVDYTGNWAYQGKCAPELGIVEDCPEFSSWPAPSPTPIAHDLTGDISQVPPGGRVELAGGNVLEVRDAEIGEGDATTDPLLEDLDPVVVPSTLTVTTGPLTVTDDGTGILLGDGNGTIDYASGALAVTWSSPVGDGTAIRASYSRAIPDGAGEIAITAKVNPVEDAGFPALANTGVPFAYVDDGVVNSLTYFYAVTAFDVNSIASGPTSIESARIAQAAVPRANAPNVSAVDVSAGVYGRDVRLDQTTAFTFDGETGRFEGPPPPTDLLTASFELFAPTALEAGATVELRVDSVQPSYYDVEAYLTLDVAGQTTQLYFTHPPISATDPPAGPDTPITGAIPSDPDLAAATGQEGLPFAGQATFGYSIREITFYSGDTEWHEDVDGAFWTSDNLTGLGGSRWFTGSDESAAYEPDVIWRGALDGVNAIQSPQPNWGGTVPGNAVYALFRRIRQSTWHAARQADVKFYWGADGVVDSVIDVTHNLPVPFHDGTWYGVGWGFRDDITGIGTSTTPPDGVVTEYDFTQGPCASPIDGELPDHSTSGCESRLLQQVAVLQPVDVTGDGAADGSGFALYFNHEFYIFQADQLPSAGTVWTHRSYFGLVDGSPGNWTYSDRPANPHVPGLLARVTVNSPAVVQTVTADNVANIHTVPDPYYATSGMESTPSEKIIKFVNLPDRAIIRIYSASGVLVDVIEHQDVGLGGEATWNVRNRNNQTVASGVYFYHVETASGEEMIGRMTVITSSNVAPAGLRN
jgi:hypothetical protein